MPTAYVYIRVATQRQIRHGHSPETQRETLARCYDFRLKDKGVPAVRGGGRGDQHVYLKVQTPTELSPKERELFEQLRLVSKRAPQPADKRDGFFDKVKEAFGG